MFFPYFMYPSPIIRWPGVCAPSMEAWATAWPADVSSGQQQPVLPPLSLDLPELVSPAWGRTSFNNRPSASARSPQRGRYWLG